MTTSITFIDGTEAVLEGEGVHPWAIIASTANPREYKSSLKAGIADARRRSTKLVNARTKMSLSFADHDDGGSPGSPRLVQATLAGSGYQNFADEDHAHVRVEHKENGSLTLVRSGQSVKEAMCVIVDVQIEIVDRGIDAAVAYAATGMVPERLMRWHVEEWLTSEQVPKRFEMRLQGSDKNGSVLSLVPTTLN